MAKGKVVSPREVAVAIPFDVDEAGKIVICLVTSRKHKGKYVLPKGGVEKSDANTRATAVREMWEEAGLTASKDQPDSLEIPSVLDHKPHKKSPSSDASSSDFVPRAVYSGHQIRVERGKGGEEKDWPEKHERERRWFTLLEAYERTSWRGDIGQLLQAAKF